MDITEWLCEQEKEILLHIEDDIAIGAFEMKEKDLEERIVDLESQVNNLWTLVLELRSEREEREKRVKKATHRALLHPRACTCTACLIYQMNKEL